MRTQGKWHRDSISPDIICGDKGEMICILDSETKKLDNDNAEFICTAVNAHDELVECLSEVMFCAEQIDCEHCKQGDGSVCRKGAPILKAQAVLDKIGGAK